MPVPGTTDPSPRNAARRAIADEIQELRSKCATLENSIQDLEGVYTTNKQLRSKVVQLETQLGGLEDTVQGLLDFKTRATKLLQALVSKHDVDELKSQLLSMALQSNDPNAFLKSVVDGEQVSGETGGDEGNTEAVGAQTSGGMDTEGLQLQLRDSRPMKDVCNKVLLHLFGAVRELKPGQNLYPHGFTRNHPEWPGEGAGDQRRTFIRFDFTKPSDDPINADAFKEYCKYVRNRGAELVPEAAPVLAQAGDATIQERCQIKYKYEADKYRRYLKQQNQVNQATAGNQPGEDVGDGNVAPTPLRKKRTTAYYRSRAEAKRKSRVRKVRRMVVPYSIAELETFETHGAQSDGDTEYETLPDGTQRKTGKYITRGWPFMSERFKTLKSLVDEMDDPKPPSHGYQPRVPGSPREGAPPANSCNQYLLREWMVDPAVLEQHPEWRRRRLVILDDEPIQTEAPSKANKRKQDKTHQGGSSILLPDAKKTRLDLSAAQGKLKDALAGGTFEELGLALEDAGDMEPPQDMQEDDEQDNDDDLYS